MFGIFKSANAIVAQSDFDKQMSYIKSLPLMVQVNLAQEIHKDFEEILDYTDNKFKINELKEKYKGQESFSTLYGKKNSENMLWVGSSLLHIICKIFSYERIEPAKHVVEQMMAWENWMLALADAKEQKKYSTQNHRPNTVSKKHAIERIPKRK